MPRVILGLRSRRVFRTAQIQRSGPLLRLPGAEKKRTPEEVLGAAVASGVVALLRQKAHPRVGRDAFNVVRVVDDSGKETRTMRVCAGIMRKSHAKRMGFRLCTKTNLYYTLNDFKTEDSQESV